MPGYDGQLVALDVNPPENPLQIASQLGEGVANASLAQTRAQQAKALSPLEVEAQQLANTQAKRQSALQGIGFRDTLLQSALTHAYDNTTLNQGLDAAAQKDPDNASYYNQFRDRYNPALLGQLSQMGTIGGASSGVQVEGEGAPPGAKGAQGGTGNLDAFYAGQSPQQLAQELQHLQTAEQIILQMNPAANAQNWDAAKQAAVKAGVPSDVIDSLGPYNGPLDAGMKIRQLYAQIDPHRQYLAQRLALQGAGAPEPITDTIQKVGNVLFKMSPRGDVKGFAGEIGIGNQISSTLGGGESAQGEPSPAQAGAAAVGVPHGPVYDQIDKAAQAAGASDADRTYLKRLAFIESDGGKNMNSGNSSTGVFQFHPKTFEGLGGTDIHDVGQQTQAALKGEAQSKAALQSNGIQPTDANAYIMHQQGPAGGLALLKAPPNVNAVAALTPVYGSEAIAKKAIIGNGGSADMTAGQFVQMWQTKWGAAGDPGGAKITPRDASIIGSNQSGKLSDDAVDYVAQQYMKTGQLPPMGMGNMAAINRDQVINRAAAIEKETGATGADAVERHLTIKAAGASLTNLVRQKTNVAAYEGQAERNADQVLQIAREGGAGPAGSPLVNKWLQAARTGVFGDPDAARFNNQLGTFLDEYAKVVSGSGNLSAPTTDAARKSAYERFSHASSPAQIPALVDQMRIEMNNRLLAYDDQLSGLQDAIHSGKLSDSPPVAPSNPRLISQGYAPAQARTILQYRGTSMPVGSATNPYAPRSKAQFDSIPGGGKAYFIAPDGTIRVKP